jgi:surface antigen
VGCGLAALFAVTAAGAASFGGNCVYYARNASGISLDGNAAAWWSSARGRYERGQTPSAGAVLVFKPSGHMRVGHVAVVSRVVGPREILVDQANWVRGRVVKSMSVVDASPQNDWTVVKVLELHSRIHGRPNATYGFIYPHTPRATGGDSVIAAGGNDVSPRKLPVQPAIAIADAGSTDASRPSAEWPNQKRSQPAAARRDTRAGKSADKRTKASQKGAAYAAAKDTPQKKRTTARIEATARRG